MAKRVMAETMMLAREITAYLAKVEKDGFEKYRERLLSADNQELVESIIDRFLKGEAPPKERLENE